jgi:hypothetical protein
MKRYQVYLNPQSVDVIDTLTKGTGLTRSDVIRSSLDIMADNLVKITNAKKDKQIKGEGLSNLIGVIKGDKTTNIAERVDEIYGKDYH